MRLTPKRPDRRLPAKSPRSHTHWGPRCGRPSAAMRTATQEAPNHTYIHTYTHIIHTYIPKVKYNMKIHPSIRTYT